MKVSRWWIATAVLISALMVVLGVGNLTEDDGGPLHGRIIFAAVLILGAVLVVAGLILRRRRPALGAKLVAVGVLPGASGLAFFWFPPAAVVGALAIATAVAAANESTERPTKGAITAFSVVAVASVAVVVVGAGLS
jgi:hypothetical protein